MPLKNRRYAYSPSLLHLPVQSIRSIRSSLRHGGLRLAQMVESGGIIRPGRITEIEDAIGERVGLQRNPDGIHEVRTGFDYDHQIG